MSQLQDEMMAGIRAGRMEQLVPFTGQSVGLITRIEPAADIVQRLIADAAAALAAASAVVSD